MTTCFFSHKQFSIENFVPLKEIGVFGWYINDTFSCVGNQYAISGFKIKFIPIVKLVSKISNCLGCVSLIKITINTLLNKQEDRIEKMFFKIWFHPASEFSGRSQKVLVKSNFFDLQFLLSSWPIAWFISILLFWLVVDGFVTGFCGTSIYYGFLIVQKFHHVPILFIFINSPIHNSS